MIQGIKLFPVICCNVWQGWTWIETLTSWANFFKCRNHQQNYYSKCSLMKLFYIYFMILLPWVPEVFLACGGNFRSWPKLRAAKKPETALEKSLAPRVWLNKSIMCMGKGSKKCQNWPETVFLHFRNEKQIFWDCYKGRGNTVGQWRSPAPPVTIPEAIAGRISAPVPGSFQKWRVTS